MQYVLYKPMCDMYVCMYVCMHVYSMYVLYKNTLGEKKHGQVGSTSYFYFLHVTKRCDIK